MKQNCTRFLRAQKTGLKWFAAVFIFLLSTAMANSQTHIPDNKFAASIKSACPPCIDASHNLTNQAAFLSFVYAGSNNITDLTELGGFKSLKTLICSGKVLDKITAIIPRNYF